MRGTDAVCNDPPSSGKVPGGIRTPGLRSHPLRRSGCPDKRVDIQGRRSSGTVRRTACRPFRHPLAHEPSGLPDRTGADGGAVSPGKLAQGQGYLPPPGMGDGGKSRRGRPLSLEGVRPGPGPGRKDVAGSRTTKPQNVRDDGGAPGFDRQCPSGRPAGGRCPNEKGRNCGVPDIPERGTGAAGQGRDALHGICPSPGGARPKDPVDACSLWSLGRVPGRGSRISGRSEKPDLLARGDRSSGSFIGDREAVP